MTKPKAKARQQQQQHEGPATRSVGTNEPTSSDIQSSQEPPSLSTQIEPNKSPPKKNPNSIFSLSCGVTIFMIFYVGVAMLNLYHLMYPLAMYDIKKYDTNPNNLVRTLWQPSDPMYIRIYLSTRKKFDISFVQSDFMEEINNTIEYKDDDEDEEKTIQKRVQLQKEKIEKSPHRLLWDEKLVDAASFSKSFLITSCDSNNDCGTNDESYQWATQWLDDTERYAIELQEGGIVTTLSSAGHGIESTSALLTLYQWVGKQLSNVVSIVSGRDQNKQDDVATKKYQLGILNRTTVSVPLRSPMWKALHTNSTLYLHVLLLRDDKLQTAKKYKWPPTSVDEAITAIRQASSSRSVLLGDVNMIKYEKPYHIDKPRRLLWHDIRYLYRKYVKLSKEMPPWVMEISKPEQYEAYQYAQQLKGTGAGYPYWKPEVSIKYINDYDTAYPTQLAGLSGMEIVQVQNSVRRDHPSGYAYLPALHVDEMGMTSDKYVPVNATITSLPLRISFDRNDIQTTGPKATTATAGGMSPARWRLLSHLVDGIDKQKQLGFDQSDIDEIKRVIADTNITLLTITLLASTLHLLFEFLTFKNDVSFWRSNNDLTGLSVRSLFLDMIGQTIIVLFLIEAQSSLLTIVPSAIGCLIALWKCQRGSGLTLMKRTPNDKSRPIQWWNIVPSLFGYELRAVRLEARGNSSSTQENAAITTPEAKKDRLIAMTLEADQIATTYLGTILLPLVLGYAIYSLIYKEHKGWYSWLITSAASAVYALGFVLMTPQLFLNWKLKSVAHLPWRVLVYKSLNTFIDDLFSFIIRMPTMARISCFRDDVVFFIYLYQRWLYPVDTSRPVEGGGEGEDGTTTTTATESNTTETNPITKKNQ